jgi:hypothetical protein
MPDIAFYFSRFLPVFGAKRSIFPVPEWLFNLRYDISGKHNM